MALTEDLEQQLRPGLGERDVAQFINDQQLCGDHVQIKLTPQSATPWSWWTRPAAVASTENGAADRPASLGKFKCSHFRCCRAR